MTVAQYKNKRSLLLENEVLRAEFLPDPGGKMVSLIGKKTGFEFLVQRPWPIYREQPFAGVYVNGECSGFDDMFPTIDTCACENAPWQGTALADHGEVWSLPWDVLSEEENSLAMSVHGVRFPYLLEKRISLTENASLRFDYSLTNLSPFDFDYLWAGHFMINLVEGTRVCVPEDCREMVSVLSGAGLKFGYVHQWPYLKDANGEMYRADVARSKAVRGFEKYYFADPLKQGWCRLEYPDQRDRIHLSFSTDFVPYLGILMNEEGWDGLYNIIIEPCSVCYDRPDVAKQFGQRSVIRGKTKIHWNMEIFLD